MNGAGKTSGCVMDKRFSLGLPVSKMRCCDGCKVRRSITQFAGDSAKCKTCVRRGK